MIRGFDLQLQEFRNEHIPEYLEYAYDSYEKVNPQIINGSISKSAFREKNLRALPILIDAAAEVNRKRGTETMFNHFYRINGQMVLAAFTTELHHFFKTLVPSKNQYFAYNFIPLDLVLTIPQNKGILMQKLAVRPQFYSKGLYQHYQLQQAKMFKQEGFEYGAFITMMPRTLGHFQKRKQGRELTKLKANDSQHEIEFFFLKFNFSIYIETSTPKSCL